jgi:hypothetical protein
VNAEPYRRRLLVEPENVVPHFFSFAEAQKPKRSSEQVSKRNLVGKQNTEVIPTFFVLLFVQLSEITDVVRKNSPSLAGSVGKLIGVCLSRPVHLYDVGRHHTLAVEVFRPAKGVHPRPEAGQYWPSPGTRSLRLSLYFPTGLCLRLVCDRSGKIGRRKLVLGSNG